MGLCVLALVMMKESLMIEIVKIVKNKIHIKYER